MNRLAKVALGLAVTANCAALGALAWQLHLTKQELRALGTTSADTMMVAGDPSTDFDPAGFGVRLDALETRIRSDAVDMGARNMAKAADDRARAAEEEAAKAYRKALEPCTIYGMC